MKELMLNGADWATKDDVYGAFFRAVGAPEWHGRTLDALADSIRGGSINQVEVPYRLVIESYERVGPDAKPMVDSLINLVHELAAEGCPVEIRVEGQRGRVENRRSGCSLPVAVGTLSRDPPQSGLA
jgi:RNAse (barnase) inhibitor barstar